MDPWFLTMGARRWHRELLFAILGIGVVLIGAAACGSSPGTRRYYRARPRAVLGIGAARRGAPLSRERTHALAHYCPLVIGFLVYWASSLVASPGLQCVRLPSVMPRNGVSG